MDSIGLDLRASQFPHLPWRLACGHRLCPTMSFRAPTSPPSLRTWLFSSGAFSQSSGARNCDHTFYNFARLTSKCTRSSK
ncbi:hypothetical protein AHAS_Ahas06G0201900 [Arachis hypogaea]